MDRISKPPYIRKKEILDAAKRSFFEKGYENTSMADISNELNVTQGLCYRYFKSKQELFNMAIDDYAKECSKRFISIMDNKEINYIDRIKALFNIMIELDNPNEINLYLHKVENQRIHEELELNIVNNIAVSAKQFFLELHNEGYIKIDNVNCFSNFLVYGLFGLLKCNELTMNEKINFMINYIDNIFCFSIKDILFEQNI